MLCSVYNAGDKHTNYAKRHFCHRDFTVVYSGNCLSMLGWFIFVCLDRVQSRVYCRLCLKHSRVVVGVPGSWAFILALRISLRNAADVAGTVWSERGGCNFTDFSTGEFNFSGKVCQF